MKKPLLLIGIILLSLSTAPGSVAPPESTNVVFQEADGLVAVEAEHFSKQELTAKRAWHIFHATQRPVITPDTDGTHVQGASGGAYLEVLPDSRWTHDEKLVHGENFSNEPGKMAVLSYKVHFATPGRYHFWARVFSTGPEDNGLHVGLDGAWPASGQRWQTTRKNSWQWDSRQRTQEVHVGVPGQLYLDVPSAGEHIVQIAMREDGIEIDKWLLTTDRNYTPEARGPAARVRSGKIPPPFPVPENYAEASAPTALANRVVAQTSPSVPAQRTPARQETPRPVVARKAHGDAAIKIAGELKQWHAVTLELAGPFAAETDTAPNPFTDYRFEVTFTHESGTPAYLVPGYFAADGNAANTSATSGTVWRAHLSPDRAGKWNYRVSFQQGPQAATSGGGRALAPFDAKSGSFTVAATDKSGRDFRAKGRLTKRGHYLHYTGTGDVFLKAGADAPETLLAYADFDDTLALKPNVPLKTWSPHVRDWRAGDPTWKDGKGKGLVGALNYLAAKGVNAFSFLTYNAAGDGDNVWPFISRDDKFHYDCSKLEQWGIVFAHAQRLGLFLHFKLQENEMDDHRAGAPKTPQVIPEALDGGATGPERKLYLRELIARYGHHLGINWNLGEENTQSTEEQAAMAKYIADTDPYDHLIVVHTFPPQQDGVYGALIETPTAITGLSVQNQWNAAHARTVKWRRESARVGRPWVVNQDEQGPAALGVPPDPNYQQYAGKSKDGKDVGYDLHDIRKATLWGTLLAGGGGVEYYFGYQLPENDLICEDFRSRDKSWDYCRIALEFFAREKIPVDKMVNLDELVGNPRHDNSRYCFAQPGQLYLVYLPEGGAAELDLSGATGDCSVAWFNPRTGGALQPARAVRGSKASLVAPSSDDWLAVIRK